MTKLIKLTPEMQRAWVDWEPGYDPPELTSRQRSFARHAFFAGWLAAKAIEAQRAETVEHGSVDEEAEDGK